MTSLDPVDTPLVSFDHHDSEFARDPYPTWRDLRSKCPIAKSEAWGGFTVVTDYEHCAEVMRTHDTFLSSRGIHIPRIPGVKAQIPIELDPPEFYPLRRLLAPWFAQATVTPFADEVRDLADELLDEVIEVGSGDLVKSLAQPLPARWILRMLGFDETPWRRFQQAVHASLTGATPEEQLDAKERMGWVYSMVADAIAERRENGADGDDMICRVLKADVDGDRLDDERATDVLILLLVAGLDTTTSLIANLVRTVCDNEEVRQRLLADRLLVPSAVEESLRLDSVVQSIARCAASDTDIEGHHVSADEWVLVGFGGANRDPAVFENPEEFVLERPHNRHMGFGFGIHRCLGAPLARLEATMCLEQVLDRMPDVRLAPDKSPTRYDDCSNVLQYRELHVEFTPGPRVKPAR